MRSKSLDSADIHFLKYALNLAHRHQGATGENPSVGTVIVKNNVIIAVGVTAPNGRPHAEAQALMQAAEAACGATLYVTLEPCCNFPGKTSPACVESIKAAKIQRVIVGCVDPNPAISGRSVAELKAANIQVELIELEEIQTFYRGHFFRHQKNRPHITAKIATSCDEKIAYKNEKKRWITGEYSRRYVHHLRSKHDAILTGIGTVLADNPLLNCRFEGAELYKPTRIILDTNLSFPADNQLVRSANESPVKIYSSTSAIEKNAKKCRALETHNIKIIGVPINETGRISLAELMKKLGSEERISNLMLESGATLFTAFLNENLVDTLYWFRSPFMIGADGIDAIAERKEEHLEKIKRWKTTEPSSWGEDTLEILENPSAL